MQLNWIEVAWVCNSITLGENVTTKTPQCAASVDYTFFIRTSKIEVQTGCS